MTEKRPILGDYFSIACCKYLFEGIEDTLGINGAEVIYLLAGKRRGCEIATMGAVASSNREEVTGERFVQFLNKVMQGERLCIVKDVQLGDGEVKVTVTETLEEATSTDTYKRKAIFSAGVLAGVAEAAMNAQYQVEQLPSTVLGETVLRIYRFI